MSAVGPSQAMAALTQPKDNVKEGDLNVHRASPYLSPGHLDVATSPRLCYTTAQPQAYRAADLCTVNYRVPKDIKT
jgi:hypothetical protein